MKFCSTCGAAVALKVPEGDSLPRYVCGSCNAIHYTNPRMIVGCVPCWEDKVLLCKRAIQPRQGLWTVPAGFMENDETLDIGAARETLEEAGARVDMGQLYAVYSIPHVNQVYLLFLAQLKDLDYKSGAESLDTRLFTQDEIPWDQIAFATVRNTLTHYFADRASGHFKTHVGVIERPPGR